MIGSAYLRFIERSTHKSRKVIRFMDVAGSAFALVGSVLGSRELLARSLDSTVATLHRDFAARIAKPVPVRRVTEAPAKEVIEYAPDPATWPLLIHRADDAGPYITCGVATARDPLTGRQNLSYNRMQFKGGASDLQALGARLTLVNTVELTSLSLTAYSRDTFRLSPDRMSPRRLKIASSAPKPTARWVGTSTPTTTATSTPSTSSAAGATTPW